MKTIRKYGKGPCNAVLLHGGPGAAGEMKPVARVLADHFGVVELLQTSKSVDGQIEELYRQLEEYNRQLEKQDRHQVSGSGHTGTKVGAEPGFTLVGYSWGAWLGFLFAARYPELVRKLILIAAGAFTSEYNRELMAIRLGRLSPQLRVEAEAMLALMNSGSERNAGNAENTERARNIEKLKKPDPGILKRLGEIMAIADSYDALPAEDMQADEDSQTDEDSQAAKDDPMGFDLSIHQSVWSEAAQMRESGALINLSYKIRCPVVAIHGENDPHPADGVEKPLTERLTSFRMVRLKKCGHTPWRERHARDRFFDLLREEILS